MLRRIGLIATALLLLSAASVSASTHTITVSGNFPNFSFPAKTPATIGDTIKWVNHSGSDHTVTGNASLNLWNNSLPINGTVSRSFTAAGLFPYHCNIHSFMHGSIAVAMTAAPVSGTTATTFTIRWATGPAATGFTYVVQKRAPGGAFVAFKSTTAGATTFKTGVVGTWQFRAKLKRLSNSAVSGFSPVLAITVTH